MVGWGPDALDLMENGGPHEKRPERKKRKATADRLGSSSQADQRPTAIDPVSTLFHLGGDAALYDWLATTLLNAGQCRQGACSTSPRCSGRTDIGPTCSGTPALQ